MQEKLIILKKEDQEFLGGIRTFPNLWIAEDEKNIWLKGIPIEKANNPIFQSLPAVKSYYLDDENRLFPIGKKTPIGKLEKKEWQPILDYLKIELPTSLLPGETNEKYEIKFISTEEIKESTALLTSFSIWKRYAEITSNIRLNRLKYAVSEKDEVIIMGNPLPAIPGKEFWLNYHILLPNGQDFEYPLIAPLLYQKMRREKGDIILYHNDNFVKISSADFQLATRSSIRKTFEKIKGNG